MKQGMASLAQAPPLATSIARIPQIRSRNLQLLKASKLPPPLLTLHHIHIRRQSSVCCKKLSRWKPPLLTDTDVAVVGVRPLSSSHHGHCSHPVDLLLISTIFIGPDVVSLLALIGLECIFHLGATLFLLMVDYCAQSMNPPRQASKSKPPPSSQLCNLVATLTGFVFPLVLLFCSQRGYIQPQLPFTPFAVLLGPYILLLLTEMLTWHWGLVCWWVLILGVQLMRVAWFVGVTAGARQHQSSTDD
ncbi:hypothetical protein V6N12_066620 [Hibiscus sabdariffa]|uniref:Uncharacterized protein n=1 Tax=Hibiscus sabdariffa TaxID=183260 RepID=A0ABR2CRB8_9ROSI